MVFFAELDDTGVVCTKSVVVVWACLSVFGRGLKVERLLNSWTKAAGVVGGRQASRVSCASGEEAKQ